MKPLQKLKAVPKLTIQKLHSFPNHNKVQVCLAGSCFATACCLQKAGLAPHPTVLLATAVCDPRLRKRMSVPLPGGLWPLGLIGSVGGAMGKIFGRGNSQTVIADVTELPLSPTEAVQGSPASSDPPAVEQSSERSTSRHRPFRSTRISPIILPFSACSLFAPWSQNLAYPVVQNT